MDTNEIYRALKNRAQNTSSAETANSKVVPSKEASENAKIAKESNVEYVPYTEAQLNRRMELLQYYGEDNCDEVMLNINQYGANTFSNVMRKILLIADENANHAYFTELSSCVKIGELNLLSDIVGLVTMVRGNMGLSRIKENLVSTCVADFFQYFTVNAVHSKKLYLNSKKQALEGYQATFNLNCQL